MKCLTSDLTLETQQPLTEHPEKLRGFIASENIEEKIYHQHEEDGLRYRYPLIHYHVFEGKAVITGWLDGVEETKKLFKQLDHLHIGESDYSIIGKKLRITEQEYGISDESIRYRFVSPWLALNRENHAKYMNLKGESRLNFLEKIITGNILSASKGLNHTIERDIKTTIVYARQTQSQIKGTPLIAFQGAFIVNFKLPELFGLGKSVSRGFGAVRRI